MWFIVGLFLFFFRWFWGDGFRKVLLGCLFALVYLRSFKVIPRVHSHMGMHEAKTSQSLWSWEKNKTKHLPVLFEGAPGTYITPGDMTPPNPSNQNHPHLPFNLFPSHQTHPTPCWPVACDAVAAFAHFSQTRWGPAAFGEAADGGVDLQGLGGRSPVGRNGLTVSPGRTPTWHWGDDHPKQNTLVPADDLR